MDRKLWEASGGAGKSSDEIVIDVIDDVEAKLPELLDEDDRPAPQNR